MNNPSHKLLVLISGNGSNLQAIIDACHQKNGMEICAVISNKTDAYGLVRAEQAGIKTQVLLYQKALSRAEYDASLMALIDAHQPTLLVLAGFMRILSPEFVAHYQGRILNIHPSLLPKYPGLHTHQKAIDAKDKEHGASVHFVTQQLDAGPVILQASVPVLAIDTPDTLAKRVQKEEHKIYPQVIEWFCQKRLQMIDEKALFDGKPIGASGVR
jgi:phosphoribosylglycinamide formyltransferase-1